MGDVGKTLKRISGVSLLERGIESATERLSPGAIGARKASEKQQALIAKREQEEKLKLAEAESDVARRKAATAPGRAGRSLLIATSPVGTRATKLGGTV